MAQFEELMGQIENDKNELFDKISGLEEENETLVNEKHSLKIELAQANHQKTDFETHLKASREQLKVLESLNTYKEEALTSEKEAGKEIIDARNQIIGLQKTVKELRDEEELKHNKYQKSELAIIQLKSEVQKEKDFIDVLRTEIAELRQKYTDSVDHKKQELGISNLMASKMFNIYKVRESTRQSNNMPISFYGDKPSTDPSAILAGGGKVLGDQDQNRLRPSTRDSTVMSRQVG